MVQSIAESGECGSGRMNDNDPRGFRGRLGRGPVSWYVVIGLAIGLVVGGAIGALWGNAGWILGDVIGGALGAFIGTRLSRSRQR